MKKAIFLLCLSFIIACSQHSDPETVQGDWLKGTFPEKLKTIEKQFRGFDNAMVETDYRYMELYWAGQDENWDYANYQVEKIKLAIENAIVRRPKRAKAAEHFMNVSIPAMKKSIETKNKIAFDKEFASFTNSCNSCHSMEQLPFFTVKTPSERRSSIRGPFFRE